MDWNAHEGATAEHAGHVGVEAPVPVISFLSGSRRGTTLRLVGDELTIGTDPSNDVRVPLDTAPLPLPHHARLVRRGRTYELEALPGARVWVNGRPVDSVILASGDVLEIGRDGAVLRFRLYEAGTTPYKSLPEVFSDCLQCARSERSLGRKASAIAVGVPRELATQTSRHFRGLVVLLLVALAGATGVLARRSVLLERRLMAEVERVQGLTGLLERARGQAVGEDDMAELLAEVQATSRRVRALEARTGAGARVIADAARATILLQSSYRFHDPGSGRPLRLILRPDGRPLTNPSGDPALSLEGDGPPLEIFVTGTGFVVSSQGYVLTNRHVAEPWAFDAAARGILEAGFTPRMTRFLGYLPGVREPFEVAVAETSDRADLALLRCSGVTRDVPVLPLAEASPHPGDEVVVLGYPLGLRALIARSDAAFVERLRDDRVSDFWEQARRLSEAGYIAPLASRGIVGQVTSEKVVYDAETAGGGSGGPVLTLDGKVVAVNTAVLPEFGGSNMGVPSRAAGELLSRVEVR